MQGRKPPAYQEYAADILANREFRLMSLAERGLFSTLRMECWVNGNVPASITELAKYLGFESAEIENLLTERVKLFFNEKDGSLYCPELDAYKKYLDRIREKQKNGGKKGAAITNGKKNVTRKVTNINGTAKLSSNPQLTRQVEDDSLVEQSKVQQSKTQSLETNENSSWVSDYDDTETLKDND